MNKVKVNRRGVLKAGLGAAAVASTVGLSGCATSGGMAGSSTKKLGRVVVVGGGFGGATAAKYLNMWSEGAIEVTLIERQKEFYSCPISNLVIGGVRKMNEITRTYDGLERRGIKMVYDEVTQIDPVKKVVMTAKGASISYDRLVVSPGIDFRFETINGLNAEAQKVVLHSWKAGPQTVALRAQLEAMPNGGTFVMTVPKSPYRCPPGPYERACQVANYFKREKPKSKVVVLDSNEKIVSKGALFSKAWKDLYPGLVEYVPYMNVTELDLRNKTLITEVGDRIKGDVLNVIPQQKAGQIAYAAGLVNVNNLWAGVDWLTLESQVHKNVHVLGDATSAASGMPKSGHMANQHGKMVASAIVELMNGRTPQPHMLANTCYSFVDEKNVVHVAAVYNYDPAKKTVVKVNKNAGGLSTAPNELEGKYAIGWARNIWSDMLT